MKILVVSDTHGRDSNLLELLERVKPVDMLIHCGDSEDLSDYIGGIAQCPIEMVRGNCDFCSPYPAENIVNAENHRILIAHGHLLGVKSGVENLVQRAKEVGADIALYGHTHIPDLKEMNGVTVMNPGSLSFPRQIGHKHSFGTIEIDEKGEAHFTIKYLE